MEAEYAGCPALRKTSRREIGEALRSELHEAEYALKV